MNRPSGNLNIARQLVMIITEILERNARMYSENTALIERDPGRNRRMTLTWRRFVS